MGKLVTTTTPPKLVQFSRNITRPTPGLKPAPNSGRGGKVSIQRSDMETTSNFQGSTSGHGFPGMADTKVSSNIGISGGESGSAVRVPLGEVVSDCVKRWFKDTLKEAKTGDINMQVLVGQMYYNGYGVPRDAQKGRMWLTRASKTRTSVWKVVDKRPGYNASDSDSDEIKSES